MMVAAERPAHEPRAGHRGPARRVIGVKNRAERTDCPAAAEAGPLSDEVMAQDLVARVDAGFAA